MVRGAHLVCVDRRGSSGFPCAQTKLVPEARDQPSKMIHECLLPALGRKRTMVDYMRKIGKGLEDVGKALRVSATMGWEAIEGH